MIKHIVYYSALVALAPVLFLLTLVLVGWDLIVALLRRIEPRRDQK